MARRIVAPPDHAPSASPLSAGVVSGQFLFVSGQTASDVDGVEGQTRTVLTKVGAVLRAAGADYSDVVRCGVYLRNIEDFAAMNVVYRSFFPTDPPARTTIECKLAHPDVLVEIDCVANVS
jgi:reactive intermediate/imine deaminase